LGSYRRNAVRNLKPSGQALVEFAFVLPILLLLMVAIIDFGIIFYSQMAVSNAAWEGARAGATIIDPSQGDQEIIGAIHNAAYGLDISLLAIDIDPAQDEPPRNPICQAVSQYNRPYSQPQEGNQTDQNYQKTRIIAGECFVLCLQTKLLLPGLIEIQTSL